MRSRLRERGTRSYSGVDEIGVQSPPHLQQLKDVLDNIDDIELRDHPKNSLSDGRAKYIVDTSDGSRLGRQDKAQEIVDYINQQEDDEFDDGPVAWTERDGVDVKTRLGLTIHVKPEVGGSPVKNTEETETATLVTCMYYIEKGTIPTAEQLLEIIPGADVSPKWYNTYVNTAHVLSSWLGGDSGFTYHHEKTGVFGEDAPTSYPEGTIPNLHALFREMVKSFEGIKSTDSWQPADMALCRKGKEHAIASDLLSLKGNIDAANTYLRQAIESRDFIGVSLKKMPTPREPEEYNFGEVKDPAPVDITEIHIQMNPEVVSPKLLLSDGNKDYELSIRGTQKTSNFVTLEPKIKGSQAQLGKTPQDIFRHTLARLGGDLTSLKEIKAMIQERGPELQEFKQRFLQMAESVLDVFPYARITYDMPLATRYIEDVTHPNVPELGTWSLRSTTQALEVLAGGLIPAKRQSQDKYYRLLNEWLTAAKKQGETYAPFLKIGENGYTSFSSGFEYTLLEAGSTASAPNLHMTHVDEAHIIQGPEGADKAKEALRTGFNKLTQREKVPYNVKWDGAPAVYVGWVKPEDILRDDLADQDKVFIIALKALFAKTPRVIASRRDIEEYYGDRGDLREKLIDLWESLNTNDKAKKAIPKDQIWQGDFLFGRGDLDEVEIDEEDYVVFQPNTILYAVKQSSDIGREIANADVGVVWHTRYKGKSLSDLTTSFDLYRDDIKKLKEVSGLWSTVVHGTYEGDQILGDAAKNTYESLRSRADVLLSSFNNYSQQYQQIRDAHRGTFVMQFNAMINNYVKDGNLNELNSAEAYPMFISYLENKYRAKMQRLSGQGKKPRPAEREWERVLETMQGIPEEDLREICRLLVAIMKVFKEMKMIIIEGMNHVASGGGVVRTYLVRKGEVETLEPASHEGFVITTKDNVPFKFVDREQFSRANFSDDYKKGWEH